MNVVIISQFFFPERFLLNDLAIELSSKGYSITVITGQPNYPDGKILPGYSNATRWTDKYENITVLRVPIFPRGEGKSWQLLLNYLSFIISCTLLGIPRVFTKKVDIIFAWGTSPILQAIPALFLKLIKRKKLYLWVQDLWPETLLAVGMIKSNFILKSVGVIVRVIYKMTDFILIQSPGFKASVLTYGGLESKIHWIPNWSLAPKTYNGPTDSFPKFNNNKFNVLFAGNLGKAQDLSTIVEAAKLLKDNKQIQIYLLGEGSEKSKVQQLVKKGQLNNIYFLPGRPINEMPFYFSKADCLLVTLIDDSAISRVIPSKIQSYMAAGKPIVAAVNGESYRTLVESRCAATGPSEDPKQLALNIKKLSNMTDKELSLLGNNGKKYYANNFKKEIVLNKLINLFS